MDFDEMMRMSPEALDHLLEREVEKVIASAPSENQPRLRAIHNRCQLIRQTSKNPMESLVRIQREMWDSFYKFNEVLNGTKNT